MIKLARDAVALWRQGLTRVRRSNEWAHGWPGMLARAAGRALEPGAVTTAAAMAYYAVFALFPLVLLSIAIASLNLSSLIDESAGRPKARVHRAVSGPVAGREY